MYKRQQNIPAIRIGGQITKSSYQYTLQATNTAELFEWAPKVEATEALRVELGYFVECIESGRTPFNDGLAGLRVVRMLEAADESLKRKGEAVYA